MKLGDYVILSISHEVADRTGIKNIKKGLKKGIITDIGKDVDGDYLTLTGGNKIHFFNIHEYFKPEFKEFKGKL